MTLGTVGASVLYLRQLIGPLDTIMIWIEMLQSSSASFARVEGLAAVPLAIRLPSGRPPAGDRIEIRGVRYAYDAGRDVLHDVDLTVRPGERLAIVGLSGAGQVHIGPADRRGRPAPGRLGHRRRGADRRAAAGRAAPPGRAGHPGTPRLPRVVARQPDGGRAGRRRCAGR